MNWTVEPARHLSGDIVVPGDKSISHRAVLLASVADGESVIDGLADGQDLASSIEAIRVLGTEVGQEGADIRIRGCGLEGLRPANQTINCGNSGTTMRLLAGLLAGQHFTSTLTGDASLCGRPMRRVAEPLHAMGASVRTSRDGTPPLEIAGPGCLRAITFRPEVASAQVKSCVLLAGLYADGPTTIVEGCRTRDHSERLLVAMGADVAILTEGSGGRVTIQQGRPLGTISGRIPGDISSAAYWLVGATLLEGSRLRLPGVGMNPTRAAIVDLLVDWGADIQIEPTEEWCGEPVADLMVRGVGPVLTGGVIDADMVPGLIDELPLIAALGAMTLDGVEINGASELRVKESDRIATTAAALRSLGVVVDEYPEGLAVAGGQVLNSGTINAAGDHRIALAMAAVGLTAHGLVTIENAEAMAVSYPGFATVLESVAQR